MRIAFLLSGGVDSSVALKLLKDEGHQLTAYYIKVWLQDELTGLGDCPWEEDLEYAKKICDKLEVPLEVISLQKAYWDKVVAHTISEIKKGRTPNPDFLCNSEIKFGEMLEVVKLNHEAIASGHYASAMNKAGKTLLKKAKDAIKDQTYFLAGLKQEQLNYCLFPLGNYLKKEVREIAEINNFPNFNRKDSQGVCFLGKIKFQEFVKFHLGTKSGKIIDIINNRELGEHEGHWFYTIGQRQGLNLSNGPWYVCQKDIQKNIIYVNPKSLEQKKFSKLIICHLNILAEPDFSKEVLIKIRHGEKNIQGFLELHGKEALKITLNESDSGIAEGQYAVVYQDNICRLSGMIIQAF